MSTLSIAAAAGAESFAGNTTSLRFAVALSAPAAQRVSLAYATADSAAAKSPATAGTDYTATAGALVFEIGQTLAFIDVPILGDAVVESEESFDMVLSAAVGATLGKEATLTATGTIADDEPTLSIADATVDEGAATTGGLLHFAVTLSAAAPQDVTVAYATADGSKDAATAGADYTATSGTLTIATGKTTGHVDVPVLPDSTVETDETLSLTLSTPGGAGFGKSTELAATGTIIDDESATGGSGTLSVTTTSSYEDGIVYFSLSLSAPTSNEVSVAYAAANTKSKAKTGLAKSGQDFAPTKGTLTFAPGETARTIAIPLYDDNIAEGTETFSLVLSNAQGAAFAGGGKTLTTTGTLLDDEPTLTAAAAELYEPVTPADGTPLADNLKLMRFAVALSAPASEEVAVTYAATKTKPPKGTKIAKGELTPYASPGQDFVASSGILTFVPGAVTAYAYVEVYDDARVENDETFSLVLSKAVGAGFANSATSLTVTGTILDNEPSVSL